MKYLPIYLILLLAVSCQQSRKSESELLENSNLPLDSLVYEQLLAKFDLKFSEIEKEYESATDARKLELDATYEKAELEMVEAQKEFIKANPNSQLNIPILWEIDWSFNLAAEYRSYLEMVDPSQHGRDDYIKLEALINQMEKVEVGKIAPDFEMNNEEGTPVRLSSLYPRSRYLLVDFWASTCGPCRLENVNIRAAYDQFQSKGFDVLGVSTDVRKEHWLAAVELDGLIWTNLCSLEKWNENEVVKSYALRQVSQNFLLDQTGMLIAKDLRGEELIQTLEKLLN
jgi:peroxiredoxin